MRDAPFRLVAERAACLVALPLLVVGIYDSLRLAAADSAYRMNTTESLQKAVRLEADDADYHELLADHLEGEAKNADAERQAAARISPLEAKYWIDLGIRAEIGGDQERAGKFYRRAAEVDRMFVPRWTLMNFYFRRQDQTNFWLWAKRALEMAYGDQTAAFRLCWLMTNDAGTIERILPANNEIRRNYLNFLIDTHRLDDLSPIDREVAEAADATEVPWLQEYCERTLAGNSHSAVNVWNALCRRGLKPFGQLSPDTGSVVTNGDFRVSPTERGFDWRIPVVDGVQVATRNSGAGISIRFTGDQPEDCVILFEFVPLAAGREYRVSYEYGSPSAAPASGLRWEITDLASNTPIARSGTFQLTGAPVSEQMEFKAGAAGAARLVLRYRREPGTVRHEEALILNRIGIQAQSGEQTGRKT